MLLEQNQSNSTQTRLLSNNTNSNFYVSSLETGTQSSILEYTDNSLKRINQFKIINISSLALLIVLLIINIIGASLTKHNEIYYVLCFEFTMNYSYTNKNSEIIYLPMQTDKIPFFIKVLIFVLVGSLIICRSS